MHFDFIFFFFFFQAEDGIRDRDVTGVQTCALPILLAALLTGENGFRTEFLDDGAHRVSWAPRDGRDRKSTRLNSSHITISYAVFCLKKKIKSRPRWLVDLSHWSADEPLLDQCDAVD